MEPWQQFFINHILPRVRSFEMKSATDDAGKIVGRQVVLNLDLSEAEKFEAAQRHYYENLRRRWQS